MIAVGQKFRLIVSDDVEELRRFVADVVLRLTVGARGTAVFVIGLWVFPGVHDPVTRLSGEADSDDVDPLVWGVVTGKAEKV